MRMDGNNSDEVTERKKCSFDWVRIKCFGAPKFLRRAFCDVIMLGLLMCVVFDVNNINLTV